MSCSVLALEFGYAAETAFVTPLLFNLGLSPQAVSLIWALGPAVGVWLQPVLGSLSDRSESKYVPRVRVGRASCARSN